MGKRNKLLKGGLSRKNHLTVMKSKKPQQVTREIESESEEEIKEVKTTNEPPKPKPLRHRRTITKIVLSKGQKRRQERKEKLYDLRTKRELASQLQVRTAIKPRLFPWDLDTPDRPPRSQLSPFAPVEIPIAN